MRRVPPTLSLLRQSPLPDLSTAQNPTVASKTVRAPTPHAPFSHYFYSPRKAAPLHPKKPAAYSALFKSSSEAIKKLAPDPHYIGADLPGFFGVLHTWGRTLQYHPHIHYIVPGGTLSSIDGIPPELTSISPSKRSPKFLKLSSVIK